MMMMSTTCSSSSIAADEEEEEEEEESRVGDGIQPPSLTLIPGLPNDLSALILAFVPFSHHSRLKSISKSWNTFFSSKSLFSFRHNHIPPSHISDLLCIFPQDPSIASPYLFHPQALAWCPLPPMPCNPHVYGLCNFTAISLGPSIYVLGGSAFDTRSFPLDRPCSSSAAFRFDFATSSWHHLSPMITPRGSFACAAIPESGKILVAGGGSRHAMFGAAGSRMNSVEMYDTKTDEWTALDELPRFRAGCVGLFIRHQKEDKREFWVMGGYGESRTISGVFPVDEYYRDAVVMDLKNGGGWIELGTMWGEGERKKLGKIVAVEDQASHFPSIFMLDGSFIFRYEKASNRWWKETTVPEKATDHASVGFVALHGELHVMMFPNGFVHSSSTDLHKKGLWRNTLLMIQVYHPRKKTWRRLVSVNPPLHRGFDFKTAVMCTFRV